MNFAFDHDKLFLVGIAASAGGIEPMRELIANASCHGSMSFVVVPHLARERDSNLRDILAQVTSIKAVVIEDGMEIENCHVYAVPPNAYVIVEKNRFSLKPRPQSGPNNVADVFFRSLASVYKSNAIAVVLSGSAVGADGSEGVQAVKKSGGHTYAQDPDTAIFPDMPQLAISTGAVDTVATPKAIGDELSLVAWASN